MTNRCFISHASEDKDDFVRPLAHELKRRGVNIWYDEFSLRLGDSLRRSIDKGLAECEAGVVILSRHFFEKEWPQRELDALLGGEIAGTTKLFAVWHGVDASYVRSISPLLADKIAVLSDQGVEDVADALSDVLPIESSISGDALAERLELHLSQESSVQEYLRTGCEHRFFQLQAFFTAYQTLIDEQVQNLSDEFNEHIERIIHELEPKKQKLQSRFSMPSDVEIVPDEPLPEPRIIAWVQSIEDWVSGTLEESEVYELIGDLDTYFEVDYLYILFGIPNFAVSENHRKLLDEAIRYIGIWVADDKPNKLEALCERLRESSQT
jgi:hypothetical protein